MPQEAWSKKREKQYQEVKKCAKKRGEKESRAEEIAARTVNKNRARSGEAQQASRGSVKDVSPQQRGGRRSHEGAQGRTKQQLYDEAKRRGIGGRSAMSKQQLQNALNAKN